MHESRRFDIVMHALRVRVEAARREALVTRYEEPRDMIAAYFSVPTLCAIALVHVYWACGGRRGKRAAIPEHDGVPLLHPSTAGTCTIAAALLAAACVVAARAGWVWQGPLSGRERHRDRRARIAVRGARRRRFPLRRLFQADPRLALRPDGHAVLLAAVRGARAVDRVDGVAALSAAASCSPRGRRPVFSIVAVFAAINCTCFDRNGTGSIYNARHSSPMSRMRVVHVALAARKCGV